MKMILMTDRNHNITDKDNTTQSQLQTNLWNFPAWS